jgi:hypothetical protein
MLEALGEFRFVIVDRIEVRSIGRSFFGAERFYLL